jgi:uncharacterized membrane protein YczE
MPRRILQLVVGLVLYGAGCALTITAGLGVDPWTVLAEGVSTRSGIGVGWITNVLGAAVLLLWIPLRQRPGVGTVANIALVGTSIQFTLALLPEPATLQTRVGMLGLGIVTVAIASGLYIGARFGPGPRDGLMTGLSARFGLPIWQARLTVEGTVLVVGWMLGGTVGIGTVAFALCIGPLVHLTLPLLRTPDARPDAWPAGARVASGR